MIRSRFADRTGAWLSAAALLVAAGCAPRLKPLAGVPAAPAVRLPNASLPPGHHKLVFEWELSDPDFTARGDGAARIAAPDSARLDFFLAGGMGSGAAILIGDELRTPAPDVARRLIPPPPLLWAALGRLVLPPQADTVLALDGGVLRADIGRPVAWRVTFRGDTLTRLEHVEGGRIVEWVERMSPTRVRYRQETSRRQLTLDLTSREETNGFDASIWSF